MRKIEIDTETDKMETIVFSTLETVKGKPLTAFLTHHFCAVHLLEMRNQVQFALKRVEINIHLLERGVSKKICDRVFRQPQAHHLEWNAWLPAPS